MPIGIYVRTEKHIGPLVARNKSLENRMRVSRALTGHVFSEETLEKMRKNHPDTHGENNPNWRGDKVTFIGVHLWLTKNFKKRRICEICGKQDLSPVGIDWALVKGKKYERKRENFIELCRKCHTNYDRNKEFCINGHKQIPENLYHTKTGKRLCKLCNKLYRSRRGSL